MAAELGVDATIMHQVLDKYIRQHLEEISKSPVQFKDKDL
jgi:hypothetical protein